MNDSPDEIDADAVITRVLSGDIEAYAELVRGFENAVGAAVAFYINDRQLIDELIQQTFVKAYYSLKTYEIGRGFLPWLRAIARNEVRMELRTAMRRQNAVSRYADQLNAETAGEDLEAGIFEQIRDYFRLCLEELPAHLKELIHLRYDLGRSILDLANELGRKADAVKKALSRTRIALRDCIAQKQEADNV